METIYPAKIVEQKGVVNADNLLKKQDLQIGLSEVAVAEIEKHGHIIFDFGMEMNGGIRIMTYKADRTKARIRFGESLVECNSDIGGRKNATNNHSTRDMEVELQFLSDMTFGQTGFRFVRIDFDGDVSVKTVVAVNNILKRRTIYTYCGDDEEIKEIFSVAKRTVDLCSAGNYIWDGVKRDRLVWIGDMHPEMMALTTMYGRLGKFEHSLDFVKKQTPLPNWMNGYPMYSMWWAIIVSDYNEITGAVDFTKKQLKYMQGLVDLMDICVKENGELDYPSYFVDWPTSNKPDELQGVRAINIIAVKKIIKTFEIFDIDTVKAKKLLEKLLKQKIVVKESKSVAGLKYFAVGLDESDKKLLANGGAFGMSTFMSYYILTAVASFDKQKAIEMMKSYYGAMLDKGATTFWEDFSMDWIDGSSRIDEMPEQNENDIHGDFGGYCYIGLRHSLCHGWSAGVIKFIKENC